MFMYPRRAIRIAIAATTLALSAGAPPADAVSARQSSQPRVIEVVARRYAFEPAQVEVVAGEPVRIMVRSGDGLHGFSVPKLRIKKEIPRGETVAIELTADTPGEFPILCSEFCGDGHEEMKGLLIVKTRPAKGQ